MKNNNFLKKLAYYDGSKYLKVVLADAAPASTAGQASAVAVNSSQINQLTIAALNKPKQWINSNFQKTKNDLLKSRMKYFYDQINNLIRRAEMSFVPTTSRAGYYQGAVKLIEELNNVANNIKTKVSQEDKPSSRIAEDFSFQIETALIELRQIIKMIPEVPSGASQAITPATTPSATEPTAPSAPAALPDNLTDPERRYVEQLRRAKEANKDAQSIFEARIRYICNQGLAAAKESFYKKRAADIYRAIIGKDPAPYDCPPGSRGNRRGTTPGGAPTPAPSSEPLPAPIGPGDGEEGEAISDDDITRLVGAFNEIENYPGFDRNVDGARIGGEFGRAARKLRNSLKVRQLFAHCIQFLKAQGDHRRLSDYLSYI